MVLAAGEDQKVQQGLFENYLEAKVKDPHLDKVSSSKNILYGFSCYIYVCLFVYSFINSNLRSYIKNNMNRKAKANWRQH